jgi:hypothetical protein
VKDLSKLNPSRNVHREEPEGKRLLGRPRRRWEEDIKMVLRDVGCGRMGRIELAQDRDRWRALVEAVMNFRHFIKCGEFLD